MFSTFRGDSSWMQPSIPQTLLRDNAVTLQYQSFGGIVWCRNIVVRWWLPLIPFDPIWFPFWSDRNYCGLESSYRMWNQTKRHRSTPSVPSINAANTLPKAQKLPKSRNPPKRKFCAKSMTATRTRPLSGKSLYLELKWELTTIVARWCCIGRTRSR